MKRICLLVVACLLASSALAQEADAPDAAAQIVKLRSAIARATMDADGDESLARRVDLPLARLKLKKAELRQSRMSSYGTQASGGEVVAGLALIEMIERDEAYFPARSTLDELAYISDSDGSVQPYYVRVPEAYTPDRAWPLIVFLHGYVPSITMLDPWLLSDEVCQIAEDNGCLLLIPYGRRNSDFQGVGERDVFDSIEHFADVVNVDRERIYLSGVSMGGMGAWTIGLRFPGYFAAVAPISGQTDMFRWWGWDRAKFPPWKRFLVDWDNALEMVPNARGQNIFVQHGENDTLIPVIESRSMVEAIRASGVPCEYYEFPGASHYIYWESECYEKAWSWQKDFRLNPRPEHVSMKVFSLNYSTNFWLTVRELQRWGTPATIEARVMDGGARLDVRTDNVALFEVDTATCPLLPAERYHITAGERTLLVPPLPDGRLIVQVGPSFEPQSDWPPVKRRGLCGPCEDVFNSPFIVVQGTAGDLNANEEIARNTATWLEEWEAFADGQARVCTDRELSDADIQRFNLVLLGTPKTNSVLARLADELPITIGDHRYTILDKTYEGPRLGLAMCYPNPLNPDRYLLIYSGPLHGRRLSSNHKHDLLPDFEVFDADTFTTGDTEAAVCGGWFDVDWLPKTDLVWEGKGQLTTANDG